MTSANVDKGLAHHASGGVLQASSSIVRAGPSRAWPRSSDAEQASSSRRLLRFRWLSFLNPEQRALRPLPDFARHRHSSPPERTSKALLAPSCTAESNQLHELRVITNYSTKKIGGKQQIPATSITECITFTTTQNSDRDEQRRSSS